MEIDGLFYPAKDNDCQIVATVVNPVEVKGAISLNNFTVYTLKGSDIQGPFESTKRYSDFNLIRNALIQRWPGCYVPPLPRKKLVGKNDHIFVEFRRQGLEVFCQQLSKLKHLWYSKEFQTYLRSQGDVQKVLKGLPVESSQMIIEKYNDKLQNLEGKEVDTMVLGKINEFYSYAKRIQQIISNFKEMAQGFIEVKNTNNEQYGILFNYLMPEYQKTCLANYVDQQTTGRYVFADSQDQKLAHLIANFKQLISRQQFEELYRNLDLEDREIQAFLEVFKVRDTYENKLKDLKNKERDLILEQQKLNAGKQNMFKSLFKGNIEENKKTVNQEVETVKVEISQNRFLCDLIAAILGHFQINRFKEEKFRLYYQTIKRFTEYQLKLTEVKSALYQHILQNHNLL